MDDWRQRGRIEPALHKGCTEVGDDRAARIQRSILRRMTGEDRLRLAFEMSDIAHDLCRARIRQQHPDWTDEQVTREMARSAFSPRPSPW
jgi:hypothetical protein